MFLVGAKVFLKPVDSENIDEYIRFLNAQDNDVYTEHAEYPHSRESTLEYLKNKNLSKDLFLGIYEKQSKKHIGNIELCDINHIHQTAEYKILLDYRSSGKGYAKEASELIINHGFEKLNLYKIYLGVNAENSAAVGLYKKLGFIEEGVRKGQILRNGKRQDLVLMAIFTNYVK